VGPRDHVLDGIEVSHVLWNFLVVQFIEKLWESLLQFMQQKGSLSSQ